MSEEQPPLSFLLLALLCLQCEFAMCLVLIQVVDIECPFRQVG